MEITFTTKELLIGLASILVGGIFAWVLTSNIKLTAQLEALNKISPRVDEAIAISSDAKAKAESALTDSEKALERSEAVLSRTEFIEKQANEVLENIQSTPLFSEVTREMDKLRKVASEAALAEAKMITKIMSIEAKSKIVRFGNAGHSGEIPNSRGASICALSYVDDDSLAGACKILRNEKENRWEYRTGGGSGDNLCAAVCTWLSFK